MGVFRKVIEEGNGTDKPVNGDTVTMQYTGWLYDKGAGYSEGYKGKEFDSSVDRGDFIVKIGVGQVIKGWDEGIVQMSLGEKALLTISPDFAYGERGFPPVIPPNSILVFEVQLKAINDKKA